MNVNKLSIILLIIPFFCFSQKKDAYFIIESDDKEYIITNVFDEKLNFITIFERTGYKNYENDIQKFEEKLRNLGRKPTREEFSERPKLKSWDFEIISRKKVILNHCELQKLNLVNFEWLKKNSWKENNPNILFKNLYFIYKIEKETYILYKVERTIVIH
jgi:hypothetical protein